jgi:hypothetical protein
LEEKRENQKGEGKFLSSYGKATTVPVQLSDPVNRSNSLIEPQNRSHQVSGALCSTVKKSFFFSQKEEFKYVFYS